MAEQATIGEPERKRVRCAVGKPTDCESPGIDRKLAECPVEDPIQSQDVRPEISDEHVPGGPRRLGSDYDGTHLLGHVGDHVHRAPRAASRPVQHQQKRHDFTPVVSGRHVNERAGLVPRAEGMQTGQRFRPRRRMRLTVQLRLRQHVRLRGSTGAGFRPYFAAGEKVDAKDDAPAVSWMRTAHSEHAERFDSVYIPTMQVVILIGLQAAGKSTFYRRKYAATHGYISRDQLKKSRNQARRERELIDSALADGRDVIVDDTNARIVDRAAIIDLAKRHGATVVGYFFEPDVKQSLARNRGRDQSQRVPDVAIYATAKRLEPPSLDEGFDELLSVRATSDNEFLVTPLGGTGARGERLE